MNKKCRLEIYTNEKIDTTKQPLFLGCYRNTQRYDKNKYEKLAKLADNMQDFFWIPEEIKMNRDYADYPNLTTVEKHIFNEQLSKLVMLDSVQGRNPILTFGQLTTNPEFEACLIEQTYFESRIHSRSYSYLIERVHPDPGIIFDRSWEIQELRKETNTVVRDFNALYDITIEYIYKLNRGRDITEAFMKELRKKIILGLVSMNILEGIRFYLGFGSIWSITEFSGKMPGSSRILQLISRDENKHLEFSQYTINTLKRTNEFKDVWHELVPKVYDMYFEASEEEFSWADELFKHGSIMGMNAEIGKMYIKFLTNKRLQAIGLKPIYPEIKKNPLPWIRKYLDYSLFEKALQESEEIDYKLDPINYEKDNVTYEEIFSLV